MANMLGADFNVNTPTDDDLVKRGASWIRDTRRRIKAFLTPTFDLETGLIKDGLVTIASLADMDGLTPGTYKSVTVNAKGLVTAGTSPNDSVTVSSTSVFYVFEATVTPILDSSGADMSDPVDTSSAGTVNTANTRKFQFTVPAGVTRLSVKVQGGGGGGGATTYGGGGGFAEGVVVVSAGQIFSVEVGQGGSAGAMGGVSQVYFDATHYVRGYGGNTTAPGTLTAGAGGLGEVATYNGVLTSTGGAGSATLTGVAGGGFAGNRGAGGIPTAVGSEGFVSITYWLSS
jgi:hypothetical protein